jgi:DNA-binding MarR family transcriptional regulator
MVQKEVEYFSYFAKTEKIFRKICHQAVAEYDFTPNEIVVMMFLHNYPEMDSASDIAHRLNISKGLVAKSVESLSEKGFVITGKDRADRRLIHLSLTEKSDQVMKRLKVCREVFVKELHQGIPREDLDAVGRAAIVMNENLEKIVSEMRS